MIPTNEERRIAKEEGQSFIVMEYLDGITLNNRIAGKPLKTGTLLSLRPNERATL
jgi:hypothetical protein